jgi:hypothetical protein
VRVLRRGGGLHGGVHPRRLRVILRRLALRAVRVGGEGDRSPRPRRRRGGGTGVPRGGVQGLQLHHEDEPDAVPGQLHAPHRTPELRTPGGVVPGAPASRAAALARSASCDQWFPAQVMNKGPAGDRCSADDQSIKLCRKMDAHVITP